MKLNYIYIFVLSLFPYIFIRFGETSFTVFDLGLLLLGTVFLLFKRSINVKPRLYYYMSWVFIIISIIPFFIYGYDFDHIAGVLQYVFILFFIYPLLSSLICYEDYVKMISFTNIAWACFIVVNAFLLIDPDYYKMGGRFVGFYNKPLSMGLMAAIMTPYLLNNLLETDRYYYKVLLGLTMILSLVIMILSGSRAALAGLLFGLLFYFFLKYRFLKSVFIVPLFIAVFAGGFLYFSESFFSQYENLWERNTIERLSEESGTNQRFQNFILGLPQNEMEFLFGVGLNNSAEFLQAGVDRPHNFFVSFLKETGFLGMLAITVIMILCLGKGIKRLFKNLLLGNKNKGLIIATFSAGIVLFVAQQASAITNHRGYWLIYMFCLWLSYLPIKYSKEF